MKHIYFFLSITLLTITTVLSNKTEMESPFQNTAPITTSSSTHIENKSISWDNFIQNTKKITGSTVKEKFETLLKQIAKTNNLSYPIKIAFSNVPNTKKDFILEVNPTIVSNESIDRFTQEIKRTINELKQTTKELIVKVKTEIDNPKKQQLKKQLAETKLDLQEEQKQLKSFIAKTKGMKKSKENTLTVNFYEKFNSRHMQTKEEIINYIEDHAALQLIISDRRIDLNELQGKVISNISSKTSMKFLHHIADRLCSKANLIDAAELKYPNYKQPIARMNLILAYTQERYSPEQKESVPIVSLYTKYGYNFDNMRLSGKKIQQNLEQYAKKIKSRTIFSIISKLNTIIHSTNTDDTYEHEYIINNAIAEKQLSILLKLTKKYKVEKNNTIEELAQKIIKTARSSNKNTQSNHLDIIAFFRSLRSILDPEEKFDFFGNAQDEGYRTRPIDHSCEMPNIDLLFDQ